MTVGHTRHKEFAKWVSTLTGTEPGGRSKFGKLEMLPNGTVYSYAMCIARVFRNEKVIMYRADAQGHSKTTSQHLSAVLCAGTLLPSWSFLGVDGRSMDAVSPADAARTMWGRNLKDADLPGILHMRKLLVQLLAHTVRSRKTIQDELHEKTIQYVGLSGPERDAMQVLVELKLEELEK